MSNSTRCNKCDNIIFFHLVNGNWKPFEDEFGNTPHRCIHGSKSISDHDRVQILEKNQRRMCDTIHLLSERLVKLEKLVKRFED